MTHVRTLADGTRVLIRPLLSSDRADLAAGFHRLSPEARHLRFVIPPSELSDHDLDYLTNLDYQDHFAWAAFAFEMPDQPGIGVARYVRDPADPTTAEAAVTVLDEYQHRGLGTLLTRMLGDVAAEHGIRTFVNYVLWENAKVIAQLRDEGARVSVEEPGLARIELDIPAPHAERPDTSLHRILRAFSDAVRRALGLVQPGPPQSA